MNDHRQAQNIDLKLVRHYFEESGFKVVTLEQKWRHVTGILEKNNQKLFLKLASTSTIAPRTQNEVAWDKLFETNDALPVRIPRIKETGEWEGLFWFLSEYVPGYELVSPTEPNQTQQLEKTLPILAQTGIDIYKLNSIELLPKDLEKNSLAPQERLPQGVIEWQKIITKNVSKLVEYIQIHKNDLKVAPMHGDFVPWHFRQSPSGTLYLVDGEAAMTQGVKFYDIAYFYHRVYTKLKRPEIAKDFLKLCQQLDTWEKTDYLAFKLILAQRIIGGYLDAQYDQVTSMSLQEQLEKEFFLSSWT